MGTIGSSLRLVKAGWVLAREGVFSSLPGESLSGAPKLLWRISKLTAKRQSKNANRAEQLSRALNRLGPSYVKFGQFLGSRPDIVGKTLSSDLEMLQDKLDPFETKTARKIVEENLGRPVDEMFDSFEDAVAAASIAQVHCATIAKSDGEANGGERVAVKVIRPKVRVRFFRELETFRFAARMLVRLVPEMERLKPEAVVDTLEHTTKLELDLRMEAAAFSEMGENSKDDPSLVIPKVNWERSGRDVLTMQWIDGIKLNDAKALDEAGLDRPQLAQTLLQSFLRHAIRDGLFHGDMHPGNLFATRDGNIAMIDLGIMGRLSLKERRFLAEILFGFITRDYMRVSQIHFDAGYVPAHHSKESFAQAIRAIGEPIHGQSAETLSMAKLLTLLFEITELFDMRTREELILLQKSLVIVEGVARMLDPKFNMWTSCEPVVRDWISKNLGPIGELKDMHATANTLIGLAKRAPELATRGETLLLELEAMSAKSKNSKPAIGASLKAAAWLTSVSLAVIALSLAT